MQNQNGFMKDKQRYKVNVVDTIYTDGKNGYPDHIKLKAIKGRKWMSKNKEIEGS